MRFTGSIFFCAIAFLVSFPALCKGGIIQTANFQGSTYHLLDTNGNKWWSDAQIEAQQLGGNLVTINSAAENQFILDTFSATAIAYAAANLLPDSNAISFWIGLSDHVNEGQYVWVSGEQVTYTNWANGQPENGVSFEDFGGMFVNFGPMGQWHDLIGTTAAVDLPFGVVEVIIPEPTSVALTLLFLGGATCISINRLRCRPT